MAAYRSINKAPSEYRYLTVNKFSRSLFQYELSFYAYSLHFLEKIVYIYNYITVQDKWDMFGDEVRDGMLKFFTSKFGAVEL